MFDSYSSIELFYTQIDGSHLLVIFESFKNYLEQN